MRERGRQWYMGLLLLLLPCSCAILDMSPLTVISWSPLESHLESVHGVVMRIEFSRPVNTTLAEEAFTITADGDTLPGRIAWTDDRTLVFLPDEPPRDCVVYTMHVSTRAEDLNGRDLSPEFDHTFTTKSDRTRPQVLSTTPADHDSITDRLCPFIVTFSKPMDRASVNAAFSLSPSVNGFYSWSNDGTTFTFTPTEQLQWQTRYTIAIGKEAADIQHNTLGSDHATHLFIGTDVTPPRVDSVQSADLVVELAAAVASDTVMTVTEGWESTQGLRISFSEPVLTTSATSAVSLSPAARYEINEVRAEFTSLLTYSFPDRLVYGLTYTVRIAPGVVDMQGNASTEQASYHFQVNGAATCPPVITQVYIPSTAGDPSTNGELNAYDAIALPDMAEGETHTFFDLYIDCAAGVSVDPFSLAESFRVTTTNAAADIESFAVVISPTDANPAPNSTANEIVARVWVHVTNNSTSGQVVLHVTTDLMDTGGTHLAREYILPLNDTN